MADLLDRLVAHWRAAGLGPGIGAPGHALAAFEQTHGVRLPPDLRAYFSRVNGTARAWMEYDDQGIAFRALGQIESVAESYDGDADPDAASYYLFADYLAATWEFAIRLSPDPAAPTPVAVMWGPPSVVAGSFTEFIERYLRRDASVLEPPEAEWERAFGPPRPTAG